MQVVTGQTHIKKKYERIAEGRVIYTLTAKDFWGLNFGGWFHDVLRDFLHFRLL